MASWIQDIQAWFTVNYAYCLFVAIVAADIVGAVEFSSIAYRKGYSRAKYAIICLLFTLLGYLTVIALPDVEAADREEEMLETLHHVSARISRSNSYLKKISETPTKRVPEAVRKLASTAVQPAAPSQFKSLAKQADPTEESEDAPVDLELNAEEEALVERVDPEPEEIIRPARRPLTAYEILDNASQFETDEGLVQYVRRKLETASEPMQAELGALKDISDGGMRSAVEQLLNNIRAKE